MPREVQKLVHDAWEACGAIESYIAGLSLDAFSSTRRVRSAVMWEFAIIGESLNRLRHDHPQIASCLTDINEIIAFRNVIVHRYHSVDDAEVWRIISRDLPVLKRELSGLRDKE